MNNCLCYQIPRNIEKDEVFRSNSNNMYDNPFCLFPNNFSNDFVYLIVFKNTIMIEILSTYEK